LFGLNKEILIFVMLYIPMLDMNYKIGVLFVKDAYQI